MNIQHFNINKQSVPVDQYMFRGMQYERAKACKAERIIVYPRCLQELPEYVQKACTEEGYKITRLGGTTYKKSVWALSRV